MKMRNVNCKLRTGVAGLGALCASAVMMFCVPAHAGTVAVEANMNIASNLTVMGNFTGGTNNTASGSNSFVGGGMSNSATGSGCVIGGGCSNVTAGTQNFIGAGRDNRTEHNYSAVVAGYNNFAGPWCSFIGGGGNNVTSNGYGVVVGGLGNKATGSESFVGGGHGNEVTNACGVIVGGYNNRAYGYRSFVGGGYGNDAMGQYTSVPGGCNGHANQNNTFVWSDGAYTTSSTSNEFTVHASNGYQLLGGSGLYMEGKVTSTGGFDPPYVLFDAETRASVARRIAREVPPAKATGAALFFNAETKQVEVYVASEGTFYDLAGQRLTTITPPVIAGQSVTNYMIDADSGEVVPQIVYRVPRWQVKDGYRFNRADGTFESITRSNVLQTITRGTEFGPAQNFTLTNEIEVVRSTTKAEALELR